MRKNITGKRYYEMYHKAFFSFYSPSYFIFLSTVQQREKSLIPLQRDLIFHHCKSIDLNFHSARFKNCQLKMRKLRSALTSPCKRKKKFAKKILRRRFFSFSSVAIQTKRRINSVSYVVKKFRDINEHII